MCVMSQKISTNERGASLVQLLTVLAIISVLAGVAVRNFSAAGRDMQRENALRKMTVNLEKARADSVRRRATQPYNMSRIMITGDSSYLTYNDYDSNGTISWNESRTESVSSGNSLKLVVTGRVYPATSVARLTATPSSPIYIFYDWRGLAIVLNSSGYTVNDASFTIAETNNGAIPETFNSENSTTMRMTGGGDIVVSNGTVQATTYSTPSVTNVNANTNIRGSARVTNYNYNGSPWWWYNY